MVASTEFTVQTIPTSIATDDPSGRGDLDDCGGENVLTVMMATVNICWVKPRKVMGCGVEETDSK